jgi:hypothetical protein
VHQEQQTIHLIGYALEAELVQTVQSFRRVPAESDCAAPTVEDAHLGERPFARAAQMAQLSEYCW